MELGQPVTVHETVNVEGALLHTPGFGNGGVHYGL